MKHWTTGWAIAALCLFAMSSNAVAAEPPAASSDYSIATYDEKAPEYKQVSLLHHAALAKLAISRAANSDQDAVAILTQDYDLAVQTKVTGTNLPHPVAGIALGELSSIAFDSGDYAKAIGLSKRALVLLRPFRNQLPNNYTQSLSMIGFVLNNQGQTSEALSVLEEGANFFETKVVALGSLDKPDMMAKSNIEFSLATSLTKVGQLEKAFAYQKRSLESRIAAVGIDNVDAISARYNLGLAHYRLGENAAAETELRRAVEQSIAFVDKKHPTYTRTLEALAIALAGMGRRQEASEYLRRSLEIKRETIGVDHLNYAAGLHNLGDVLLDLEQYQAAADVKRESGDRHRKIQGDGSVQGMIADAGASIAEYADGDRFKGQKLLEQSYSAIRTKDPKERVTSLKLAPELIVARWDNGEQAQALALAQQFLAEMKQFDRANPATIAEAETLLAFTDRQAPNWAATASAKGQDAVTVIRRAGWLETNGELSLRARATLELVLRIASETKDPALALNAMTVLAGSRIAQANRLLANRAAEVDPVLASKVRQLQDQIGAFRVADSNLLRLLGQGDAWEKAKIVRDNALASVEQTRGAIANEYPNWVEVSGSGEPNLALLQSELARDEAILGVIPAFDSVYVLTLTRGAAAVHRMAKTRKEIYDLVGQIRLTLPTANFDTKAAAQLYEQIFPAATAPQLSRIKSLRFVASGPLASLPFATLLDRQVTKIGPDTPWLIRRFALRMSATFENSLPKPATSAGKTARFLGVGSPSPFKAKDGVSVAAATAIQPANFYFRGGSANQSALASLPPLPASALEIRSVANAMGSRNATILTGDQASEAGLNAIDLSEFKVILFATHGLISGEMEGVVEPSLVMAPPQGLEIDDGLLTATEIAKLRINANWVILSACNSAAGENANAPAYSGLTRAFRYAGARAILVSHWPVRDDVASALSVAAIRGSAGGLRRDVALQRAMLKLISSSKIKDGYNPYLWAPFALVD